MLGGLTADESHNIDWLSDTIKIMLCTSSYTPNQDTHQFKSSITGEVSGTGYVEGGATLTGKTITYDPDTNMVKLDADDVVWENSTITARYAVIYDDTPENNTDKPVLGYIDFEEDKSSNAGNFTLQWNTNGIFTLATP